MVSAKQFGITLIMVIIYIILSPIYLQFAVGITDPFVILVIMFIPVIAIIALIAKAGSRDVRMGFRKEEVF